MLLSVCGLPRFAVASAMVTLGALSGASAEPVSLGRWAPMLPSARYASASIAGLSAAGDPSRRAAVEAPHATTLESAVDGQIKAARAASEVPAQQVAPIHSVEERQRRHLGGPDKLTVVGLTLAGLLALLFIANVIAFRALLRATRSLTGGRKTSPNPLAREGGDGRL